MLNTGLLVSAGCLSLEGNCAFLISWICFALVNSLYDLDLFLGSIPSVNSITPVRIFLGRSVLDHIFMFGAA